MDAATRKQELAKIRKTEDPVMTGIPLNYRGGTRIENVYRIPLDYLIYNKYNGRTGSAVLSYEKQNGSLDAENETDKKIIEDFLWDSKPDRNKKTRDDLIANGQQKYGIVTADGTIIDGNRRAMLLNRAYRDREHLKLSYPQAQRCQYFLAIILPEDATEKDIHQLETIYQMSEDAKLDYNPIEKYLKCKELKKFDFSDNDIADFMGEKPATIKQWLRILDLMEEYLKTYGYEGIYTQLEKTEGPFVDLSNWLESYNKRGANVNGVDWDYSDFDLNNLKLVCFDYIRDRYEDKEFRAIGATGKNGSIFFHKDIWDSFFDNHDKNIKIDEKTVDELHELNPNEDLTKVLKRRDADWQHKADDLLKGNLRRHTNKLENVRSANKPAELIERALNALQAVDTEEESIYSDKKIEEMIKEISRITWDIKKQFDHPKD